MADRSVKPRYESMKTRRVRIEYLILVPIALFSSLVAFDEVKRKPNFDLWLSGVGTLRKVYAGKSTFL